MDALSDVIRAAQLSGGVFLHAEFTAPWCIRDRLDASQCGPFLGPVSNLIHYHYVVEGSMQFRVEGDPARTAGTGDLVLFPRNHQHLLGSDLGLSPESGEEIIQPPVAGGLATIRFGGEGARTRLVCGYLGSEGVTRNPVLEALPPVIHLSVDQSAGAEWIRSTFHYAADEVAQGRPGSETVLSKLSELLFVEAVRRYLEDLPDQQSGWLAGLKDPYVSRVLALVHGRYGEDWTLDALGREVGLSRSALVDRFTRLIGMAPMQYLGHWRMQIAASRLRTTRLPLAEIGAEIGYESEAAFSRAFKKFHGAPPATWRREHLAGGSSGA